VPACRRNPAGFSIHFGRDQHCHVSSPYFRGSNRAAHYIPVIFVYNVREDRQMSETRIQLDEQPSPEDFRKVLDGVRTFNRDMTGNERPRPVACFLRDGHDRIVGGVQGNLWGRSMHIDALWVDDNYRGQNHGSELMKRLEDYAAAHGYPLVYLETASFQALPFYQGLGYEVFGELAEITDGHTLYFLKKEMSPAA
jgi:ribosomal protein S18 acetylase RimI-like enzyme